MYRKRTGGWLRHLDFILWDLFSLLLAFALAYATRHGRLFLHEQNYVNLSLVMLLIDFALLVTTDAMDHVLSRGYYRELAKTVKHVALVTLLGLMYMFVIKESAFYSRIFIGCFIGYYAGISYLLRLGWKQMLRRRSRESKPALYIISTADRVEDVVRRYRSRENADYSLTGICLLDADHTGEEILGVPVTSSAQKVRSFLCREWVDEAVLSLPEHYEGTDALIDDLAGMGVVVHLELDALADLQWERQVERIADRTVLTVGMHMATPAQVFLKRAMDIVGGLVGCLITVVLTLILGPMIYIQSPGPIFFAQTRVGKNGKLFKMYKFRSMYPDAEARKAELMAQNRVSGGLMFKLDYDPRIIGCKKLPDGTVKKGIGNFIRDWSLDEFPQFWNVLKGDLSLVGTRPPTVDEWEQYEPHHRARLAGKPGITGMWQVSGRSRITDFEQVVELDKKYIREWSMGLDLRILVKTVGAVLRRDGSM